MRKIFGLVAAVALLAGCGGSAEDESGPDFTDNPVAAAESVPMEVREAIFVRQIRSSTDAIDTDEDLVRLGKALCTYLDESESLVGAVSVLESSGYSDDDAATITGASIGAFCPEHDALIEAAL